MPETDAVRSASSAAQLEQWMNQRAAEGYRFDGTASVASPPCEGCTVTAFPVVIMRYFPIKAAA